MRPISEIVRELEIPEKTVNYYGKWKAKVGLEALHASGPKKAKLILVTAMTPTPYGEGKTVTSIGLAMGLRRIGRRSVVCIRQPSLGPVFGVKGGGAGGGRSTLEPMQEINMRFTGDIDAVGSAHNLLAAVLDNHMFQGNELSIDARSVTWRRVVDMNDRSLRQIVIGLGGAKNGIPREDGFMITAASEVMAILCLSRSYSELKEKLSKIIVGYTRQGADVRAGQLKAVGAMAALLKEALQPNLVQTAEGTPAIVHGGPFGNIAHGTASFNSILLGMNAAEYCVAEAGFGSDLGAEKFVNIVSRLGGFSVDAAVVVATIKALKHHGGVSKEKLSISSSEAVRSGLANLQKHVENVQAFGLTPVVAINRFPSDSQEEIQQVAEFCNSMGVPYALSTVFTEGGEGAEDLARRVIEAASKGQRSGPTYSLDSTVQEKLESITSRIYGGEGVDYAPDAIKDIRRVNELGLEGQPICVAKTQLSLSDNPTRLCRPHGFRVLARRVEIAAGAGFNVVRMGDIVTMPGLPPVPASERIDLSDDGTITGLF